jgi:hypothetical protein
VSKTNEEMQHKELSMFWAGYWPTAINATNTILNAWVLNTPMTLVGADLVKFLSMLNSNKHGTIVFKNLLKMTSLMTTSHTIYFPHPSIHFIYVGLGSA